VSLRPRFEWSNCRDDGEQHAGREATEPIPLHSMELRFPWPQICRSEEQGAAYLFSLSLHVCGHTQHLLIKNSWKMRTTGRNSPQLDINSLLSLVSPFLTFHFLYVIFCLW
jgi:hypothetical protein